MSYWWRVFRGLVYGGLSVGLCLVEVGAQTTQQARLVIDHKVFAQPQRQGQPLAIQATISSPAGIHKAEVFCRQAGGRDFSALKMEHMGQDVYRAVVPDWMTASVGLEYYISATDQQGRSASQGFVGFPLIVRLAPPRQESSEGRVKALDETLELLRKSRQTPAPALPGGYNNPPPQR
jgi:hypothetical protein